MHPRQDEIPMSKTIGQKSSSETGLLLEDSSDLDIKSRSTERTTNSSSPVGILWSSVYSSDEESQQRPRWNRQRCYSDPLSEEIHFLPVIHHHPRRRSRSSCSKNDEALYFYEDSGDLDRDELGHVSADPKNEFGWLSRFATFCNPSRLLSVLFVLCCYTTFCLPYPGVRPEVNQVPRLRHVHSLGLQNQSLETVARASMLHARASPELELAYRPGLEQYYKQEGFATHAWTKYTNMGALGLVILWAVVERSRRGEFTTQV